jgi:hypothetical protein
MNLDSANLLRNVGRTPRSAADPLVGLLGLSSEYEETGPGGPPRNTTQLYGTRYEPGS